MAVSGTGRGTLGSLAALLLAAASAPALAASPSSGQIDESRPRLSFTGGPYFVSNPLSGLPGMCATESLCDVFELRVDLPAVMPDEARQIHLVLSWPGLEADLDVYVYAADGTEVQSAATFSNPEQLFFPARPGVNDYQIVIVPYRVAGTEALAELALTGPAAGPPPPYGGPAAGFAIHAPPDDHHRLGWQAGEPSIGLAPDAATALAQAGLQTLRVDFDDATSPARARWREVSPQLGSLITLDPVLESDPVTGRVFVSQLIGMTSLFAYSDDLGASWQPAQIGPPNGGVDHQGIGAGPYPADSPFAPTARARGYPHAVYFCSQALATAFCARSDDGGLSFGPGVPIFGPGECAGFHGKPKVDAAGTVYLPIKECSGRQALIVSEDAGLSWQIRAIPGSTVSRIDPFVALPPWEQQAPGVLYVAYVNADGALRVAHSRDGGHSFDRNIDLATPLGLRNAAFPVAAVGDPDRVTVGFLGTTTAGNYEAADFPGAWYLYAATSLDAGQTWGLSELAPGDPVQGPGGICVSGLSCGFAQNRNLLEFNDMVVDARGRVHMVYADGCIDDCVSGGFNGFDARLRIARQMSGEPGQSLQRVAEIGPHLSHTDDGLDPAVAEYLYVVTAINAHGEGRRAPPLAVPVTPAHEIRTRCFVPGERIFEDPAGDTTLFQPSQDLLEVYVAEPAVIGHPDPLVISFRVADLSRRLPGSLWRVSWAQDDGQRRFARARIGPLGEEIFEYGRGSAEMEIIEGPLPLEPGSALNPPQDLITLVIDRAALGLPARGALEEIGVRMGMDLLADVSSGPTQLSLDDAIGNSPQTTLARIDLHSAAACDPGRSQQQPVPARVDPAPAPRGGGPGTWLLAGLALLLLRRRRVA